MKKIFLIIFSVVSICSAQQVTIKDKTTLHPLELVSIYSKDLSLSAVTSPSGKADITSMQSSNNIVFSYIGYETVELSFQEIKKLNFVLLLEQTTLSLGQVVVSANKWEQDKSEVPVKIQSIKSQETEFQNPQTAADMLASSGSVYIQKSQLGGGSPIIRGFATNRLLMVVDGVRMNTAIFRTGNIQNVISLDANSIANTEVIFGPGSVIYGSDAIGGVMNFNTITPKITDGEKLYFNTNVMTRWSSANNERTGSVNINLSPGKWGFVTSATFTKFDDLAAGSNGPDEYLRNTYQDRLNGVDTVLVNPDPKNQINSGYDQVNFMQKIRFKPDNDWDVNYGFHYSNSSDVPRYDRLIMPDGNGLRSAQWYYGPQFWMMNHLSVANASSNSIYDLAKINLAFQKFEESRHDRRFGRNILNHRTEKVDAFSANLDLIKSLTENSNLYYGVEAVMNKLESTGESENILTGVRTPISTRYPDGSTWNSYGAYVTYKNHLTDRVIFNAGVRFSAVNIKTEFDTTFFPFPFTQAELNTSAFNGSTGLVWHPQSDLQFNLNLSTGFRAPNIDDIGKVFDSEPGSVVVPNPDLKPEYAYNAELSVIKVFDNIAKVDITGYYTYLDNALVRRNFILNGVDSIMYDGTLSQVQAIQNAAEANIWGIQLGVDIKFPHGFSFSTNFNYQKGEEVDDAGDTVPLRHAAPWFGISHIIYTAERFKADLYGVYNGEISNDDLTPSEQAEPYLYALDENGNPYSPAWFTLNLKLSYALTDYLMIFGGVENITDELYRPYSSGITAPGRNFIGSVRVSL